MVYNNRNYIAQTKFYQLSSRMFKKLFQVKSALLFGVLLVLLVILLASDHQIPLSDKSTSINNQQNYQVEDSKILLDAKHQANQLNTKQVGLQITSGKQHIVKFSEPQDGFSLSALSSDNLQDVSFSVQFVDGSYSEIRGIELDHETADLPAQNINVHSELYLFEQSFTKITFSYPGTKKFAVNEYSDKQASVLSQTFSGDNFGDSDADDAFVDSLFASFGLDIKTRKEWQISHEVEPWPAPVFDVDQIVIHHTATTVEGNADDEVRAIHHYHAVTKDWTDIGYNYLIAPNGKIYEGRAGNNGVRGSHAIPNSGTIGIALLGNLQQNQPTQAAIDSLTKLIAVLSILNNMEPVYWTNVADHNTYSLQNGEPGTACAGQYLNSQLENITQNAAQLIDTTYQNLVNVQNQVTELLSTPYGIRNNVTYIKFTLNGVDPLIVQKLLQPSERTIDIYQDSTLDYYYYTINPDLLHQLILELMFAAPASNPAPSYLNNHF